MLHLMGYAEAVYSIRLSTHTVVIRIITRSITINIIFLIINPLMDKVVNVSNTSDELHNSCYVLLNRIYFAS